MCIPPGTATSWPIRGSRSRSEDETFEVDARDLEGDERLRGFEILANQNPGFRDYQAKTSRVIPVIELTRARVNQARRVG